VRARARQAVIAEKAARQGHGALAVSACYEALSHDGDDAAVHALLAELLLGESAYEEAITRASRAIELDAGCAPAYLTLGLALDRRGGMWDRSVLVWQELAEVAPALAPVRVHLGEALKAAGFADEAIGAWREALALDARTLRARLQLALASVESEGLASALPEFRAAAELDADQDAFFFDLAEGSAAAASDASADSERTQRMRNAYASVRAEDYFAAAEQVRLVISEDPDDAEALSLAGYLYLRQGSTNEAMAVALRALTVSAKTPSAVYVLGSTFSRRRDFDRIATRVFTALAQAVPDHAISHLVLAESLLAEQRFSDARGAYERAVRLDPGLLRARFGLAAALMTQGRFAEASEHVRHAAAHDVRRQRLFEELYAAYVEQGTRS
jgi:protein O-GlcNAc transferase